MKDLQTIFQVLSNIFEQKTECFERGSLTSEKVQNGFSHFKYVYPDESTKRTSNVSSFVVKTPKKDIVASL